MAESNSEQKKPRRQEKAAGPAAIACPTGVNSRRQWLRRIGWFGVFAPLAGMAVCTVRFFFPRVLFEPSPIFKAGFPEEYPVGMVTTKYKAKYGVWIVRESEGFYALLSVCTHLGCTPVWFASENRFKCPCHGSNFSLEGDPVAGPAPVPLHRLALSLGEDGQIVVDKARRENRPGKRDQKPYVLEV